MLAIVMSWLEIRVKEKKAGSDKRDLTKPKSFCEAKKKSCQSSEGAAHGTGGNTSQPYIGQMISV